MDTKKRIGAVLLGLALMATGTKTAWADTDTTNDQASITFTIMPNIDRGVSIDTTAVDMDLGTVGLKVTTQTVRPATVTILGTLAYSGSGETTGQELDLALTFSGGWNLDTSPSVDTTDAETNMIAVYALFSDTGLSLAPTAAQFDADSSGFTQVSERVGSGSDNGTRFETAGAGALDMDHMSAGDKAHLWMLFRLPSATTDTNEKKITLTATAVQAN